MFNFIRFLLAILVASTVYGQDTPKPAESAAPATSPTQASTPASGERDLQMRERYEKALVTSPLQEQAFDRIYEGYLAYDGINTWIEKLKSASELQQPNIPYLILLGRVYARQFKNAEAITALESARSQGEERPEFKMLLGTIYYDVGRDQEAIDLLSAALDTLTDSDQRGKICRLLGTLYQRQGKTDQAIVAWKRLTERDPNDTFALLELAAIYEENRMWPEAIATFTQIASISEADPYRKCRSLRSIGQAQVQQEKYTEAVATYEQALGLVAPGNWLFEDLKGRLVSVYQDMGDLQGLVTYVQERLQQNPGDIEFHDLLAETYIRMNKFDLAEAEYKGIVERDPKRSNTYEKLLELYQRGEKADPIIATFEKLIELFPTEPDYLRRLGEYHLQHKNPDLAKTTWQRIVSAEKSPGNFAQLAEWYEQFEFPDEAIAAYEQALQGKKEKEWSFRLAALKHQKGEEDAAVQMWTGVLDEATSTAPDYAEVANVLESFNFSEKAEPLMRKAAEKDPENPEYAIALAKNLMHQKRPDDALPFFEKLAAQTANEYFQDQGERGVLDVYNEQGVLKQKQEEWEKELEGSPNDPVKTAKLARMYERVGDRPKAVTLYERCVDLAPENVEYLRTLAGAYKNAKQLQETIDLYTQLIEKDKDRAGGYYRELLKIYMDADMRKEALATAQRIIEAAPADAEARLDLAQVYMNYREPEKSFEQYRYALRLEPDEPDYFRQYGDALMGEKLYGEALEAFRKMLAVSKEDQTRRDAIVRMSSIYQQQGNLDELYRELNERIRNTPKKLAAYQELSAVYSNIGDNTRSLETLQSALDIVDDKAPALQALVRASYDAQDLQNVVTYYEQLVAMSGKPTAQEYERLGSVYAQLGQPDKAREIWNKIVEEDKNNPKAYATLAKALMDAGFQEESLAAKAKAVELNPADLKMRFAYAQDLSRASQTDQALEQLQQLLDAGDVKQKEELEKEKEKKVKQLARGGRSFSGSRYGSIMYAGQGWSGSFADVRPDIVTSMVSMADNSIGIDVLLENFKKKVEANPANYDAQKDLVLALRTANRPDEAVQQMEALLIKQPDDIQLLEWCAGMYSQLANFPKTIEKYARIAEVQPVKKKDSLLTILPLYFQTQEPEKGKEVLNKILGEFGDDYAALQSVASSLQRQNLLDEVKALRPYCEKLDPRYKYEMMYTIAQAYKQSGDLKEAGAIYKDIMINGAAAQPSYASSRQATLFVLRQEGPSSVLQRYGGSNRTHYALSSAGIVRSMNYRVSNAAGELLTLADDETQTATLTELQGSIAKFKDAKSETDRTASWDNGKFLISYHIGKDQHDDAKKVLDEFRAAGMDDVEWFNLSIFISSLKGDYAQVATLYDEVEKLHPATSRMAGKARVAANILAGNNAKAGEDFRALMKKGLTPADVMDGIRRFQAAGEKELTKSLLEEHLSGLSRNSEALSMLASIYSGEDNIDKAIALAREAWERRSQRTSSNQNSSYYYGGGMYYYMPSSGGSNSGAQLQQLHQYYAAAGRSPELIAEFEERLAKQPGSIELHRNLATLYSLSKDVDKAIGVWDKLIEKRPNLIEAKTTRADLLSQKGRFDEALAAYEEILKKNPSAYRNISWRVRDLYRRMGKGEQLAKMEDSIASKATNPDQMRELAYRYIEEGTYDKAIELLEKAIKLAPNQSYYNADLARAYADSGRIDEALNTYIRWMDSPITRSQGYVDTYAIVQMLGYYRALGRMDELKAKNDADLQKNTNDKIALTVDASIAMVEKRFADARQKFEVILKRGQDTNVVNQLVTIAEYEDQPAAVLELIDKSGQAQNYWGERLPLLYLAAGNRAKAYESWKQYASMYGGSYGHREVLNGLTQYGMWAEAEDYYSKVRKSVTGSAARSMDEIAVKGYSQGKGFAIVVDQLKSQSIKAASSELLRALLRDKVNDPKQAMEFLQPFLDKEPDNPDLIYERAKILLGDEKYDEALPLFARLIELEKENQSHRRGYADCLSQVGREDDAITMLRDWLMQRVAQERGRVYTDFLLKAGRWKEILESKDKFMSSIDPSLRDGAITHFADLDARMGDIETAVAAYKALFEQKKDMQAFQSFFRFLYQHGLNGEAYELFAANKDAGFLDQWYGDSEALVDACLAAGDTKSLVEYVYRSIRYGDRYNRDWYLDQVLNRAGGKINLRSLYLPLEARIFEEKQPGQNMQLLSAKANVKLGNYDRGTALYLELLKQNPLNNDARSGLAAAYDATGRYEEELALFANGSQTTADMESEILQIISSAGVSFRLGRTDEAMKTISDLVAWAKDGSTAFQVGTVLYANNRFEEALPRLERAAVLAGRYSGAQPALARCYAKLGRVGDAVRVALDSGDQMDMGSFAQWLIGERLYDTAVLAGQEALKRSSRVQFSNRMLMRAYAGKGDYLAAFTFFDSRIQNGPKTSRPSVISEIGQVLAEDPRRLDAVLNSSDALATASGPASVASAFLALAKKDDKTLARAARDRVVALQNSDANACIDLGEALNALDDHVAAAEQLKKAIAAGPNFDGKVRAASALVEAEDYASALQVFDEVVKIKPGLLVTNNYTLPAIAKAGTPEQLQAALDKALALVAYDEHKSFYSALAGLYSGKEDESLAALAGLVEAKRLQQAQFEFIAKALVKRGKTDEALKAYDRVARGGFDKTAEGGAVLEAIKLQCGRNPADAFRLYARLLPLAEVQAAKARSIIGEKVSVESLPQVKEALLAIVKEDPLRDKVSDLIGFYAELSEKMNVRETAESIAVAAGLSTPELDESKLWDRMIEDWTIVGPMEFTWDGDRNNAMVPTFEKELVEAGSLGGLDPGTSPKRVSRGDVLRMVELDTVFGLNESGRENKVAYAFAKLSSPDERDVTFAFGADDLPRVWINGKKAYERKEATNAFPDQERFKSHLNAGENTIVIRLANQSQEWEFCIGFVENADGITILEPPAISIVPGTVAAARAN
jgi:tetratricopeptide (TPR) repeat protein